MDFQALHLTSYLTKKPLQSKCLSSSIFTTDSLIGTQIASNTSEVLGNIKEIIMDVDTGKICYAVLSLKTNQKLLAIPWDALLYDASKENFSIQMCAAKINLAPAFDEHHWPDMTDEEWADNIHTYFGTPMKRSNSIHSAM